MRIDKWRKLMLFVAILMGIFPNARLSLGASLIGLVILPKRQIEELFQSFFITIGNYLTFQNSYTKTLFWRPWYNMLTKLYPDVDYKFMNQGYQPLKGDMMLALDKGEEQHKYNIQLYHYVAMAAGST